MNGHQSSNASFLLVIPGGALIGFGTGLIAQHPAPGAVIGLGAGMVLWGLIVSLSRMAHGRHGRTSGYSAKRQEKDVPSSAESASS